MTSLTRSLSTLSTHSAKSKRPYTYNVDVELHQNLWPIVYHPMYNVRLFYLEKAHPIYTHKWADVMHHLGDTGITTENIHLSKEATTEELMTVHTEKYLKSLKKSMTIANITELCYLALIPNHYIQKHLLTPLRYMAHGSVVAGLLALTRGWAIHLGGGFTTASSENGYGICMFADVTLMITYILTTRSDVKKIMIVDLNAHQGFGYAKDLGKDNSCFALRIFIMDIFNAYLPPPTVALRQYINCKVELKSRVRDFEYLEKLETNFLSSLNKFTPDLLVYVAGTDILVGDAIGRLRISPEGIIKRDQLLFVVCRQRKVPIVMLAGGGWLKKSSTVVADSIKNLIRLGLISND